MPYWKCSSILDNLYCFYLLFQFFDKLPELDCTFEVKPVGSFPHLGVQFDNYIGDVGLRDMFGVCNIHNLFSDGFSDGCRDDAVLFIIGDLHGATAFSLVYGFFDGIGHVIGVQDDSRTGVPGCAAYDLDEAL